MSAGERVAQQLRDAAALLESMADDVAGDIDERFVLPPLAITIKIGRTDETPTRSVKKDYLARKRLA
ncbi:hypothetical protein [Collinsella sp. AF38-3AC]|uniref:hypothetical protein n=1 Tax=Collinsella sp. AF38-3AC TaxID=2292015 RepID=UPI000E4FC425|nr:hypothetical protein [Collinsella sp. AF38-3AC]RHL22092.1 hypothetical protein DW029_09325 [Collinsella sp. AF38-3AC]